MSRTPNVIVLAGPNGAGKSTVAPALLRGRLGLDHFVNADEIARGLSAFAPETTSVAHGSGLEVAAVKRPALWRRFEEQAGGLS